MGSLPKTSPPPALPKGLKWCRHFPWFYPVRRRYSWILWYSEPKRPRSQVWHWLDERLPGFGQFTQTLWASVSLPLPLFNGNHYNYLVVSVLNNYPVNLFFFCCCCCCCCWSGTGERIRIIGRNYFLSKFILGSKSKTFLRKEKKPCLVSAKSRYPTLPSESRNILALKGRRVLPILPNLKIPQSCKNE